MNSTLKNEPNLIFRPGDECLRLGYKDSFYLFCFDRERYREATDPIYSNHNSITVSEIQLLREVLW